MPQPQPDHAAEDPAVYSATVTHIGLPSDFRAHQLPENPQATVTERAQTRVVMVMMGAISPEAGPEHLERVFGWPRWRHPRLPEIGEHWSAVFRSESRTWAGLLQMSSGREPKVIDAGQYATPVTDQMWQMIADTQTVVLCGGLRGEPTGPQMGAAIAQGRMHAVLARALID